MPNYYYDGSGEEVKCKPTQRKNKRVKRDDEERPERSKSAASKMLDKCTNGLIHIAKASIKSGVKAGIQSLIPVPLL